MEGVFWRQESHSEKTHKCIPNYWKIISAVDACNLYYCGL